MSNFIPAQNDYQDSNDYCFAFFASDSRATDDVNLTTDALDTFALSIDALA